MKRNRLLARLASALALLVAPGTAANAQTASNPAGPATPALESEQTIQLSPFTVSTDKDTGYMAADVMSGGLLATNLLKTASDVTVLTRDFLDDIGAVDMQDAQIWLTGSDPERNTINHTNPTDFGQASFFRGIQGDNNTRNYFRNAFTPAGYVTERLDGVRGPNGILYGDMTQGGKVNFTTKRAKIGRNFGSLRLHLDSFGSPVGANVELDINRSLAPNWSVRINAMLKEGEQWYDRSTDKAHGVMLSTTYQPWRGGEVRFEVEKFHGSRTNYRPDSLGDTQSNWNRTYTVNGPLTAAAPSATGVSRLTTDNWAYIAGIGVMNWRNFGRTSGSGLAALTDLSEGRDQIANMPLKPSHEFNINSPLEKIDPHNIAYTLAFEHQFDNGLTIEAAGNHNAGIRIGDTLYMSNSYLDVNTVLPNGQPNPNFGKTFSTTNGWNPVRTGSYFTEARVAAAYPIRTRWFTQTVSVVASWMEALDAFKAWQYFRENGRLSPNGLTSAALDNNQRVQLWRYWDDPNAEVALPENDGANTYRWVMSRDQHNTRQLRSIMVATHGSYFNDSVTLVGGIRHDDFHAATRDIQRRDVVTGEPTQAGGIWTDTNVTTPQIGLTWFPIKQAGLYAFQSSGFRPSIINTRKIDDSAPYNMAISESIGGGLRFNLFNNRLVGSIGYYNSFEKDRATQQSLSQINGIWTRLEETRGLPGGYSGPDTEQFKIPQLGGLSQYTDATTLDSWGWEAQLTANLTKGLRLTFNANLPKTRQSNSLPDTKAYYAANIDLWQQYRSFTNVNNTVTTLENQISSFDDGRPNNGLHRYRVNVFGNYTFQSGALKRLRLGAGMNLFGKEIIGNHLDSPFNYIYNDAYYLVTATVGYSLKLGDYPVDFNLRVGNVLNHQEPIFRKGGTRAINGVVYRNTYFWTAPRSVQLTTTVRF